MNHISQISHRITRFISDNSPAILTAMGVAGVLSTTVVAVRATPAAIRDINRWSSEAKDEVDYPTNLDIFKIAWKHYIPAAAIGTATIACIIGANTISSRRNAALMSVYSLTETAFREYREKVAENFGKNKEQDVRDEIAQERISNNPPNDKEIIFTGDGDVLCYDSLTGRYFKSNVEKIRKAQNDINATTLNEMYASQNDFYRLIGLPPVVYGEEVGWRMDNMLELHFTATLTEDGKTPCISLEYRVHPIHGYWKING